MPVLEIAKTLKAMRDRSPLVHHLTNWVTIEGCAQVTRRWGCLPVMAHAPEEVEEMAGLASAVVLNIGTLTRDLVDSMILAAKKANEKKIPVVLDAVGAGATKLRTSEAHRLLSAAHIDVIKGNAGEIASLAGVHAEVRGVESISVGGDIGAAARSLASKHQAIVVVSGARDIVTDGTRGLVSACGHPMMGAVVGTGCMSTSTVGCFVATGTSHLDLAAQAMAAFGTAGSRAAAQARGPGDFLAALQNEIEKLSSEGRELAVEVTELWTQ
jgi:hydroxyethylthiazole kinase